MAAVKDVSLEMGPGEIVALLGPSGCGKTTMLRCLSGLEEVTAGEIYIDDKLVSSSHVNVSPHLRQIGMVFQSYALWPHMDVISNIGYGLKVSKKFSSAEIERRSQEIIQTVGLAGMEKRLPSELSGGQQQRVAVARSLVVRPRVLLLDEPLSNLDANLRDLMRKELRHVLKEVGIMSVYVTHDQREAFAISDRIVLMRDGLAVQVGTPQELYSKPTSEFAATFLGNANLVALDEITNVSRGEAVGKTDGFQEIRGHHYMSEVPPDVVAMFRPEDVQIGPDEGPLGPNTWPAYVIEATYEGPVVQFEAQIGSHRVRALVKGLQFSPGDRIRLSVPERAVLFLRPDGSKRQESAEQLA